MLTKGVAEAHSECMKKMKAEKRTFDMELSAQYHRYKTHIDGLIESNKRREKKISELEKMMESVLLKDETIISEVAAMLITKKEEEIVLLEAKLKESRQLHIFYKDELKKQTERVEMLEEKHVSQKEDCPTTLQDLSPGDLAILQKIFSVDKDSSLDLSHSPTARLAYILTMRNRHLIEQERQIIQLKSEVEAYKNQLFTEQRVLAARDEEIERLQIVDTENAGLQHQVKAMKKSKSALNRSMKKKKVEIHMIREQSEKMKKRVQKICAQQTPAYFNEVRKKLLEIIQTPKESDGCGCCSGLPSETAAGPV